MCCRAFRRPLALYRPPYRCCCCRRPWESPCLQAWPLERCRHGAGRGFHQWRRCAMTDALLEARGVTKSYDDGKIEALRGVDLSIAAGEFVAITGASGSGKSTLLHLLGGLDTPTTGEVLFHNSALKAADLDQFRSQNVGFIFQAFYLLPTLCAAENVQVPMLAAQRNGFNRAEKAEALLR